LREYQGDVPGCPGGVGAYGKVKYTAIAVSSLTCHTALETHVPYEITQCYLPADRGDIPVTN